MIVALAGRRIAAEDAYPVRFPSNHIEKVKKKLSSFFIASKPDYLVCSGACGADLIALDVAGKLNIKRKMWICITCNKIFNRQWNSKRMRSTYCFKKRHY